MVDAFDAENCTRCPGDDGRLAGLRSAGPPLRFEISRFRFRFRFPVARAGKPCDQQPAVFVPRAPVTVCWDRRMGRESRLLSRVFGTHFVEMEWRFPRQQGVEWISLGAEAGVTGQGTISI